MNETKDKKEFPVEARILMMNEADLKAAFEAWGRELMEKAAKESAPTFLTAEQVAGKYGIRNCSLYAYRKKGILTPRRIGGKVFYDEAEIINELKSK